MVRIFISKRKAREEHDLPRKMDVKSVIPGNLLLVVKAREEKEARRNLTPVRRKINVQIQRVLGSVLNMNWVMATKI